MSCIAVPKVGIPNLAGLIPTLPKIPLVVPIPGVPLPCCVIPTPPTPMDTVNLGAILGPLGVGADLVFAAIQAQVDKVNALIAQIPPVNCPKGWS